MSGDAERPPCRFIFIPLDTITTVNGGPERQTNRRVGRCLSYTDAGKGETRCVQPIYTAITHTHTLLFFVNVITSFESIEGFLFTFLLPQDKREEKQRPIVKVVSRKQSMVF